MPHLKTKIEEVPTAYDSNFWKKTNSKKPKTVLTVANISDQRTFERKGIPQFIEIAKALPDFEFTVAGIEKPIKAVLKNNFLKKINFTRFVKSKINTTKNGNVEVEILKGQESFRIHSFIKSNIWTLLPSGKSKFKKGSVVDCFFPHHPNKTF